MGDAKSSKMSKQVVCSICGRPIPDPLDQYGPLLHPVCKECYQDPPVLEDDRERRGRMVQGELVE